MEGILSCVRLGIRLCAVGRVTVRGVCQRCHSALLRIESVPSTRLHPSQRLRLQHHPGPSADPFRRSTRHHGTLLLHRNHCSFLQRSSTARMDICVTRCRTTHGPWIPDITTPRSNVDSPRLTTGAPQLHSRPWAITSLGIPSPSGTTHFWTACNVIASPPRRVGASASGAR